MGADVSMRTLEPQQTSWSGKQLSLTECWLGNGFADRFGRSPKVRSAKTFPDRHLFADQQFVGSTVAFPTNIYYPDRPIFPDQHLFPNQHSVEVELADQPSDAHAFLLDQPTV
jgi:hypothetical protein